jgi:hypothetical protein
MDTRFKPVHLEQCEATRILNKKNLAILIGIWVVCTVTPFTNWIAIIATRMINLFIEVW